jgi:rare lipoprotein A
VTRALLFVLVLAGCGETMKTPTDPVYSTRAKANPEPGPPLDRSQGLEPPSPPPFQTGNASWYGAALAGRKTASGERFDPMGFTAAHNTLKLGTWVEVRRLDTGRTVRVKVNDRGPHVAGRIIDLSRRAAEELDLVRLGVVRVEIRVVDGP